MRHKEQAPRQLTLPGAFAKSDLRANTSSDFVREDNARRRSSQRYNFCYQCCWWLPVARWKLVLDSDHPRGAFVALCQLCCFLEDKQQRRR